MSFALSRVIIFTSNFDEMLRFYRDVLGLRPANEDDGWVELAAGGCTIALHRWDGQAPEGPVKIVFRSEDVAGDRDLLVARGASMSEIVRFGSIELCDGFDPDGNAFQLSSRPVPVPARAA
jgi:catechol 2,3-dioxygenase-like lactoylglutathione lyase family enzyme